MKINKKIKNGLFIAIIAGSLCIGGTMAYLTDREETVNEFTVGKIDIQLLEPQWKQEENKNLIPTQEIPKDPQIKNTGQNDAFVYLEIAIPIRNVSIADREGNRISKKNTELFTFSAGKEWTLLQSVQKGEDKVYTYAYNKILKPTETTSPLFEKVIFANIIEGQLDAQKLSVPVKAHAIQSSNTGGNSGSVVEQAKTAFQKYMNQNQG